MPAMDGYEVCRRLKADAASRDVPVIFISAVGDVLDKVQGFAVGGVDYVTKPFQAEELLMRVRTHVTLHKLQRKLQKANQDLSAQKEEAIQANQAKSRFLAAASHDLRQPLHALTLFVDALDERALIDRPE